MTDITETEHSYHPLALVDHRQPADLQLLHMPHRFGKVFVLTAAMDFCCHYVACSGAVAIEVVLRQFLAGDVGVGHHSDQTIILAYPDSAYVVVSHQFREFSHRGGLTQSTPLCIASLSFMVGPPLLG
jgi:hypothetical protein